MQINTLDRGLFAVGGMQFLLHGALDVSLTRRLVGHVTVDRYSGYVYQQQRWSHADHSISLALLPPPVVWSNLHPFARLSRSHVPRVLFLTNTTQHRATTSFERYAELEDIISHSYSLGKSWQNQTSLAAYHARPPFNHIPRATWTAHGE